MLVTLAKTCIGSEHEKSGKPLQDFSSAGIFKNTKSAAYAFAADGHGGEKYFRSATGAELACFCMAESFRNLGNEFLLEIKRFAKSKSPATAKRNDFVDKNLALLCTKIPLAWKEKVLRHYAEHPLTNAEKEFCRERDIPLPIAEADAPVLYGTTLLAAFYFERLGFWFALQIGDGKCLVIKSDGSVICPIPEDERLGFGVTTSLCGKNAALEFRHAFGFEKIAGIAVMSDGFTDSFDSEKLPDFILKIRENAVSDVEKTKAALADFLPRISQKGSGDDISIAAIFSDALILPISPKEENVKDEKFGVKKNVELEK